MIYQILLLQIQERFESIYGTWQRRFYEDYLNDMHWDDYDSLHLHADTLEVDDKSLSGYYYHL